MIEQHAQEAVALRHRRTQVVSASWARLSHLGDLDARLEGHLDGLCIAGKPAWPYCEAELEQLSRGSVFTAAVHAIDQRRQGRLARLIAVAAVDLNTRRGLVSALGWVGRDRLKGLVAAMLAANDSVARGLGIAACAVHGVSPGDSMAQRLDDADVDVRARALRTVGEVGLKSMLSPTIKALDDPDPECRFRACFSAVLVGDRRRAREELTEIGLAAGPWRTPALTLALQAMAIADAHAVLQRLATQPSQIRRLILGSGIVGDARYVPWLIRHMSNDQLARRAGDAFTLITGADVGALRLDRVRPEGFQSGPTDDPADPAVDMDPDDDLSWPDAEKVQRWWVEHSNRFSQGTRYFMGAAVTRAHCLDVLEHGYQGHRVLAAQYLSLLDAGTPLFNTNAPAWRQARLLAAM